MRLQAEALTLGRDGSGGLFSSLMYNQFDVDLYVCPQCGKVELYSAFPPAAPWEPTSEPPSEAAEPADAQDPQPDSDRSSDSEAPPKKGFFRRKKDKPDWEL